ncbi:uncharacterized protein TNCV_1535171 [Trichonephila clavipes]|uniref:Transposase n=1 Tax=Trichonephila clavipes TaxID=2585209 RepID=A0A8X6R838_TRICX|nr:uncharacterized protein TNCV_1535171 [Trichonephila clavipes]
MLTEEIHLHIAEGYNTEAMSDSKARKKVMQFKDGRTNVHDEKHPGRHSLITDDLMKIGHVESNPYWRVNMVIPITPESKQQTMEWQHTSSRVKVKAKQTLSMRKIRATVFWDRHGIWLMDFRPQGTTIISDAYCAALRKLQR